MTRYADPEVCPDCRERIALRTESCPTCDLPLTGPVAARLYQTLAQADDLLRVLRVSTPSVVPGFDAAPSPIAAPPDPARATSRRQGGLSQASVPKILLALGAGCLLVAALVFLAVTWSVMGVGGRTATLVGFTLVAGALSAWMARRGLRAAAESLALVALGLLCFDLFGARDSGWFGAVTTADFFVLLGVVVAAAGAAGALVVRRTPAAALTSAEVVASLGVASACAGIASGERLATSADLTVAVLVAALVAAGARRLRLLVLAAGAAVVAGLVWVMLLATSFERAMGHPTLRELWLDLEVWPLLAAAVLAGALAVVRSLPMIARVAGVAGAGLVVAMILLIPPAHGTATGFVLAVFAVTAVGGAISWFTPRPWSSAPAAAMVAGAGWLGVVGTLLATRGLSALTGAAERLWDGTPGGALPDAYDGPFAAWLLPLTVVAVVGALVVLARSVPRVDRFVAPVVDVVLLVGLAVASGVLAAALYEVPVWVVCGVLLIAAAGFMTWSLLREDGPALAIATVFLAGALVIGLYDEWLTAAALLAVLVSSAALWLRRPRADVRVAAGMSVAGALAGSVWTWGAILDVSQPWTALVALLLLGSLVHVVRATSMGVELGAGVSSAVVALAGVDGASYSTALTWTAVYLLVAGVAVTALALLRQERRRVGWLGGLLLAGSSWVRLWDVGVETLEAYTLPAAVALLLVGLVYLGNDRSASTMAALSPGLGLGLTPTLVWVLAEPATLRAVLLGLACLGLLVMGLRMRWTAPVLWASAVGACVVLRHATPYIGDSVPRWVVIGCAGALLIGMGVTWERRVQEARAVLGYVRALR